MLVTDKAVYYRHVLNACGQSVLLVAGGIALYGAFTGGLGGIVSLLVFGVILGVFPMGIAALLFLPLVFYRRVPPHPAVFSLAGMVVYIAASGAFVALSGQAGESESFLSDAAVILIYSVFYAAPIGFFLRHNLARAGQHHQSANPA
jgi:hypothetical protein